MLMSRCLRASLGALLAVAVLAPAAGAQAPSPMVAALRRDLAGLVAGVEGATTAVLVVSLSRGDTLFSLNPDLPLSPASNMKLYSTAAALYYLGPDFRFSTQLLADGPVRAGVLEGDLILHGTGDPTLADRLLPATLSTFRAFADTLAMLGVRAVRGDLVGDASHFDAEWVGPGWLANDLSAAYGAPVGALSLAENVVTLRVTPGAVGAPARIATVPATRGLAVQNRVTTVSSGATSVRAEHGPGGIVLTGRVRRGTSGASRTIPVRDPANFAAAALAAVLEERGIRVEGGVRSVYRAAGSRGGPAGAPLPRVLATHLSPALAELVTVTNHVSQNLYAESILKAVGRAVAGEGSFAAGARAVAALLRNEARVDAGALRLVDGSGLSRTNRLTARSTVHLLEYMTRANVSTAYLASLPQAGSARGLARMYGTPAAGNLRAKTGTVRNVSALGGYVTTAGGERLAFSIMTNAIASTARAKAMEDRIGALLARFAR